MNTDEILSKALAPLFGDRAVPKKYTGKALEYVTWNSWSVPVVWAEGLPAAARHPTMVHYYLPAGVNPNSMLVRISLALSQAGFTWPSIADASDDEGQHYVLECERVSPGGVYGVT